MYSPEEIMEILNAALQIALLKKPVLTVPSIKQSMRMVLGMLGQNETEDKK